MRYNAIPSNLFVKNRKKVLEKLPACSSAVLFSNPQMPKNGDEFHPYRQSSDFFYLTGICQEKSILVLTNTDKETQAILFILEQKPELEQWEGRKLTNAEATEISGIYEVHFIEEFDSIWNELALKSDHLFFCQNLNPRLKTDLLLPDKLFGDELARKWQNKDVQCLAGIISECRIVKEPEEIALIQTASNITREAFLEILPHIKTGIHEYEIEAIMTSVFLRNGANGHAFEPIISNGRNTCYLHYIKNDQLLQDGNLVLMDFGAEYANYASDCTRVFPVNGRFTKRQKEFYNAVLRVFKEIRSTIRPGITINDYQKTTCQLIQEELLTLGLLTQNDIQTRGDKPAYFKYFMHGISHFIGLDTHDVGEKTEILRPGMVVSCEPGIYCFEENTGIRLEDTILVTEDDSYDFMETLPIELEEIEELMNC
ncbi:MAG: aminopeptidase P N-terminal domain-containing protein [Bacteroidales bacterium]|nr:aminopeptidase P N-terminal domain-containing protein [Bacteroidales bacterium]